MLWLVLLPLIFVAAVTLSTVFVGLVILAILVDLVRWLAGRRRRYVDGLDMRDPIDRAILAGRDAQARADAAQDEVERRAWR